jgi:hypothetical protein
MRFLFGDSAPFPLGYNFLATLEAFMAAATRIVQLDHDSKLQARQTEGIAVQRVKGLEALEQFHAIVMRAVQDTAQKVQHAHALEYSQKVGEYASHYIESHRSAAQAAADREAVALRAEDERRIQEQRGQLDAFLKVARLPVISTKVSMRLHVDGKDVHHTMSAVFDNPDGIATAFALSTAKVPAWNAARKVSDFVQGVDLMVGVDKSWLRGTVQPKQLNVDEWLVTQFEIADDAFELTLKRKLVEKEALVFHLRRSEAGLGGVVEHPGAAQADGLPNQLAPQDLAALDKIWQALKIATREVLEHKEKLLAVNLDGQAVFEAGLVVPFVVRLVTMFAPTVREIAKRSPNEFELSLKMETEAGRREELYLRKDQLTSKLQPLSSEGRSVFAPLGLDSWVPGVTQTPPPASVVPPPPKSSRPVPT